MGGPTPGPVTPGIHSKTSSFASGSSAGTWVSIILLWVLHEYAHIVPPPEVDAAVAGIIGLLIGFVASYATPPTPTPMPIPILAPPVPEPHL